LRSIPPWAKRVAAAGAAATLALLLTAVGLDRLFPPDLSRLSDRSALVVDSDGRLLTPFTARDGTWRLPVTADQVDARYRQMLIAYEDKRFERHWGVDPLALARALGQWARAGHVISGASTLTMQTVRLLEPRPRTIGAKLIEMARALQLEWRYDKRAILGMYLTLAPYGGNLEGVRAASLFYFGKEPDRLTDAEAALLVALPQSPEALRPDRHAAAALTARGRVLARMASIGLLSAQSVAEAAAQPVPTERRPAVHLAAHLAERLRAADPDSPFIRTTIDGGMQTQLEALARRYQLKLEQGATIALLVVENGGRKVRAYVGSGDYFDSGRLGQNDLVQAVRSPGSTLKPFIYGLAFDDLLIHPETIVVDRPMRFGDYAPENFDKRYRGQLTAREALQLSLNLPAVALLDRLGPMRLVGTLEAAGTPLRLPDAVGAPGLPIALGGAGITLADLVTLYAGLADGGSVLPLRYTDAAPAGVPVAIMQPSSAWYLTRILEDMPPPPGMLAPRNRAQGRTVAYKTGTSYGFRDAWAIGYDSAYTVGVWVGRPDGSFSPGRMGRDAAAPVLFEVFDMLPRPHGQPSVVFAATPPAGVLLASNADLPLPLRRFDPGPSALDALLAAGDRPRIAYPADRATVDLSAGDGRPQPLLLRASGGRMPLLWLVNGVPVASAPFKRQAQYRPDGAGATRITVIDSAGVAASVEVWIQ
jgi:penicillin-binding protein 1C